MKQQNIVEIDDRILYIIAKGFSKLRHKRPCSARSWAG